MFELDLEKAEEPEIKLPTSVELSKKQESSRKTATSAVLTMPNPFDCVENNKLWKILQEMSIPDHLTCLLRNLHAGQEARARTGQGSTDWIKTGKGVHEPILSSCLFNLFAEYIMKNVLDEGWMKHKLESKLLGEISITSDM